MCGNGVDRSILIAQQDLQCSKTANIYPHIHEICRKVNNQKLTVISDVPGSAKSMEIWYIYIYIYIYKIFQTKRIQAKILARESPLGGKTHYKNAASHHTACSMHQSLIQMCTLVEGRSPLGLFRWRSSGQWLRCRSRWRSRERWTSLPWWSHRSVDPGGLVSCSVIFTLTTLTYIRAFTYKNCETHHAAVFKSNQTEMYFMNYVCHKRRQQTFRNSNTYGGWKQNQSFIPTSPRMASTRRRSSLWRRCGDPGTCGEESRQASLITRGCEGLVQNAGIHN